MAVVEYTVIVHLLRKHDSSSWTPLSITLTV